MKIIRVIACPYCFASNEGTLSIDKGELDGGKEYFAPFQCLNCKKKFAILLMPDERIVTA